jgi:hypothetical protein
LPKLGGKHGFSAVLCDGSVVQIRPDFDVRMLRLAITRADGMVVDWEKLKR